MTNAATTNTRTITLGRFGRPTLSKDGRTMVVRIPISLRLQGGRKQVVTPAHAAAWSPPPARVDSTIVKAVVRAHRWRDLLETGRYDTLRDLANSEKINESYLGRVLRLTLLSPAIIEAVLAGTQRPDLELAELLKPFLLNWAEQERLFLTGRQ